MQTLSTWRQPLAIVIWLSFLLALIWVALFGIGRTSDKLLASDAEQSALTYAHFLSDSVPGIDRLLEEGVAYPLTLQSLRDFRNVGEVFRFKIFGHDGRQLLLSDDLDSDAPLTMGSTGTLIEHQKNPAVAAIVLGGSSHITLQDGSQKPDRPDVYSEAYVPLWRNGKMLGVIEVYVDQTQRATAIAESFVQVAFIVGSVLALIGLLAALQAGLRLRERRQAQHHIRYLAEHDHLSGALNRISFTRAMEAAAERHAQEGTGFSLLCIDLDHFKEINDTLGHQAGDAVLRQISKRLQALVRPGDVFARLGGDEFAILLWGTLAAQDVEKAGNHVVEAVADTLDIDGHSIACHASVGAARFGHDADTIEDLLHRADLAMYRSKTEGRARFSFYDPELDRALQLRRQLTLELRAAIVDGQLSLHYQPLYASDSSDSSVDLVGYEALMRWHHPTRGTVPPSTFIPLAEETGLIVELGAWALRSACDEASSWPGSLKVAVNLSPAQFNWRPQPLPELIGDILRDTGMDPGRLELEITESLLMTHTEETLATLNLLSSMGIRIAMDDFGTGYSSLSYLWRFPFDKVKIDQAFTRGLETDEKAALVIRSIVSLAHSMGIRVNAEGVETEAQRAHLQSLGCDELQGYLLGRPSPIESLAHLDEEQRPGNRDRAA